MEYYGTYSSPFGLLTINFDDKGVSQLQWSSTTAIECDNTCTDNKHFTQAIAWLDYYFGKTNEKVELPQLNLDKYTAFHTKVWRVLLEKTKEGMSLSYSDLAQLIGSPHAARAVGTAMKRNPLPLFIPCHRVLPKRGGFGSYSGGHGASTKKQLLEHEARVVKQRKQLE
ncbi:Cysteine methyltransferase [Oopsacas minuta]|uniref:Methylated-DNA--protein-cysteine methyltransferase n=1 Tax=Oopsacas minuta TaxID=111878 RepID=A0AAV7JWC6_9METZ|nr:Cysteine methyltransferase [Oopsacas minuta]